MIGVQAAKSDAAVVAEFFELFKTPWEFWRPEARYQAVVSTDGPARGASDARVVIEYESSPETLVEGSLAEEPAGRLLRRPRGDLAVYTGCRLFPDGDPAMLLEVESQRPAAQMRRMGQMTHAKVGYNLFREVRFLLSRGQPVERAGLASLDHHVDLLRQLIVSSGARCSEIPPAPPGYRFIAALTHDVDHPSIRLHRFDHTMFGFLYRAVAGSVLDLFRWRTGFGDLLQNWQAAAKLPLVHLGLARDFWLDFVNYPAVERGHPSTFFVIPFQDRAGKLGPGPAPRRRAAAYSAAAVAPQIEMLRTKGCEIALHGIDAWCDEFSAKSEMDEIRKLAGGGPIGVRMHWLYFDEGTLLRLDRAGADYDSTVGYNGAIGFRAGTAQAYKPLGAKHLLELPLIVMDTALFYPSHLNLRRSEAWALVSAILDHAEKMGGCITINWHDRSISPERQWGGFYRDLVEELEQRGAWITSAGKAVEWYRKRRALHRGEAEFPMSAERKEVQ